MGNGNIKADTVKNMLGLADRQQTMVLYEKLLAGDISAVMENLQAMYTNGSVPTVILQDLIDITHLLAKVKIVPAFINDASLSENDREMCKKMCDAPINILSKIWQMLIKGLSEIQYAAVQIDALEMILMRIAYSASLPSPSDLLKELKKKSGLNKNTPAVTSEIMTPSEVSDVEDSGVIIETTAELLKLLTAKKQPLLLFAVKNDLSFKEFADGRMHISVSEKADKNLIANLRNFLKKETGKNWQIDIDYEPLSETLAMLEAKELDKDKKNISEYPLVKAILSEFNGAKIETIIRKNIEDAENESETEFVVPEPVNEIYEEEN